MEIATDIARTDSQRASVRSSSESDALQSHFDRASLFELDTDRFSECLNAIVPSHVALGDMDGSHATSSHWRADSPRRVASRRASDSENEASSFSLEEFSILEKTDGCTELPPVDQGRSLYGVCAPLLLRESFVEEGNGGISRKEGGSSANLCERLLDLSEDWYDVAGFERESAARFLQLLEHQQSQWLTVPNNNCLLPLPRLQG